MNVHEMEPKQLVTRESHGIDEFPDMSAIEEMSSYDQHSGVQDNVHVQYSMLENPHEDADGFEINDSSEGIRPAAASANPILVNGQAGLARNGQEYISGEARVVAAAASSATPILLSFSPILEVDDETSQRSHQRTISHQQSSYSAATSPAQSASTLFSRFPPMQLQQGQDQFRKSTAIPDIREEEEEEKKNLSDQWNYRQLLAANIQNLQSNNNNSHNSNGPTQSLQSSFAQRLSKEQASSSSSSSSQKFQQQRNDILGQIERIQSIHQIHDIKRASEKQSEPFLLSPALDHVSAYVSPRLQHNQDQNTVQFLKSGSETSTGIDDKKLQKQQYQQQQQLQHEQQQQQLTSSRLHKQLQLLEKQSNIYKRFLSGQISSLSQNGKEKKQSYKSVGQNNSLSHDSQSYSSIIQPDLSQKNTINEIDPAPSQYRTKYFASPTSTSAAAPAAATNNNDRSLEQQLQQSQQSSSRLLSAIQPTSKTTQVTPSVANNGSEISAESSQLHSQYSQGIRKCAVGQRIPIEGNNRQTSPIESEQMIASQLRVCLSEMDEHRQVAKQYLDQTAQTQKYVMNVQDELLGKIQQQIQDMRSSLEKFEQTLHVNINRTFTQSYDSLCTDQDALSSIGDAIDEQYNRIIGFLAEKQPAQSLNSQMASIRLFIQNTSSELERHAYKSGSDSAAIDMLRRSLRPILVALESAPSHLLFDHAAKSILEGQPVVPAGTSSQQIDPASAYTTVTQQSASSYASHQLPVHASDYQTNSLSHRSRGNSENINHLNNNSNPLLKVNQRGTVEDSSRNLSQIVEGSGQFSHRGSIPVSSGAGLSSGKHIAYQQSPKALESVSENIGIGSSTTGRTRGFLSNGMSGEGNYRSNRSVDLFQSISLSSRKAVGSSDLSSAFRNINNNSNNSGFDSLPRNSHLKHTLSIHEITPNSTIAMAATPGFSPTKFNSVNSAGPPTTMMMMMKELKVSAPKLSYSEKGLLSPTGASHRLFERAQKKQVKKISGFLGNQLLIAGSGESKGLTSPHQQFNRKSSSQSQSSSSSSLATTTSQQRLFLPQGHKSHLSRISPKRENSHKEIFESKKSNPEVYDKILTNLNKYRDLYATAKRAFFESPSASSLSQ